MPRPKGSKNKGKSLVKEAVETIDEMKEVENEAAEDTYISSYEASQQLNVSEPTIKIWIAHGHLTGRNGMVSTRSIHNCRFNTRRYI